MQRRSFLRGLVVAPTAAATLVSRSGATPPDKFHQESTAGICTLGFSTYGMKGMEPEAAIRTLAKIGYDSIEMTVTADSNSAPSKLTAARRSHIRQLLAETPLKLTSLMEHLIPSSGAKPLRVEKARLAVAMRLAHDLCPTSPPLIQTVLGGGNWERQRTFLRDRMSDWLEVANEHETTIAIKPHRGGMMSRPSEANWLIEQLEKPSRLRICYDYSHYAYRAMPMAETIATALPYTAHVAVKDAIQRDGRVDFELPGAAGTIDYSALLRQFHQGGYRGDICCETSSMVWKKADYDAVEAAKQSYQAIAAAFEKAGIKR